MLAAKRMGYGKLVVAGGVASNSKLRQMLKRECDKANIKLYVPSPVLCTDNAAMIGCGAYYKYMAGLSDGLYMDAHANFSL
jgi:N6-L-threonylcarbamoyladenine synthase